MEKNQFRQVLTMSGAFCSCLMGAAFASGQEMLQFFTAFGWCGIIGLVLSAVIFSYVGFRIQLLVFQKKEELNDSTALFNYLFGPKAGNIVSVIVMVILVFDCIMMINGAGAAVEQYFTGSGIYGRLILTALSVIAIVFGLSKMVEIIGAAGYGMIACMLIIALISIMKSNGVSEKAITVSGQMISLKGAGTWYLSAMKYAGNSILTLIPVWILCGKKAESKTTAETSPIFGSVAWFGTALLIVFAQFSAIDKVAGLQIPNLRLAQIYAPSFSVLFLFVLVLAAFSAITSELWYLIDVISHKTGFSYKATVVICGSALFIISGLFSFNVVVHWLYTFCFYIGLIVLGMLLLT